MNLGSSLASGAIHTKWLSHVKAGWWIIPYEFLSPQLNCQTTLYLLLSILSQVTKSRMVMDVLNIQGIQRSLERLADLLSKVQKALGGMHSGLDLEVSP